MDSRETALPRPAKHKHLAARSARVGIRPAVFALIEARARRTVLVSAGAYAFRSHVACASKQRQMLLPRSEGVGAHAFDPPSPHAHLHVHQVRFRAFHTSRRGTRRAATTAQVFCIFQFCFAASLFGTIVSQVRGDMRGWVWAAFLITPCRGQHRAVFLRECSVCLARARSGANLVAWRGSLRQ